MATSTEQMIQDAYASIGRTGFGGETSQIDQPGFDYWKSEIQSGRIAPDDFRNVFDTAVQDYVKTAAPDDPYVAQINALSQTGASNESNLGALELANVTASDTNQASTVDLTQANANSQLPLLSRSEQALVSKHGWKDNGDGTLTAPSGRIYDYESGGFQQPSQDAATSLVDTSLDVDTSQTGALDQETRSTTQEVSLPDDWMSRTADQKIDYFNQNNIDENTLLNAGVTQEEINWMKDNGYTGSAEDTSGARGALDQVVTEDTVELPQIVDYRGRSYSVEDVTNLANELSLIADPSKIGGGVFGVQGGSVGFDYGEISRVLGKDPSTYEQVLFDAARQLIDQGITSLSDLSVTETPKGRAYVYDEVDEFGQQTGNKIAFDGVNQVYLTPEQIAQVKTEVVGDDNGPRQQSYIEDFQFTGKTLVGPDGRVISTSAPKYDEYSNVYSASDPLSLGAGKTYTGSGGTRYFITYDENGMPRFGTEGQQSGVRDLIGGLTFIGSFIPGFQPFAMALNAAQAAERGDTIGALASLAGAAGGFTGVSAFSDASTALRAAQAIETGNIGALVSALASSPEISKIAGSTMLGDNISFSDIGRGVQLATGLQSGNIAQVLSAAGGLVDNANLRVAGAAANIIQELQKPNPNFGLVASSISTISNITTNAANNITPETVRNLTTNATNNAANSVTQATGVIDLGEATYVAGVNAGLSHEEALDLSNQVSNVSGGGTDLAEGTILQSGTGPGAEVSTVTGPGTITTTETSLDDRLSNAATFGEAFRLARDELGAGKTFTWNGQEYSTNTREEDPTLAAASDRVTGGSTTAALAGGIDVPSAETSIDTVVKGIEEEPPAAISTAQPISAEVTGSTKEKLLGKLDDPLLNPADLTSKEMESFIDRFVNATPEQRLELLSGSDSSTYTVIDNVIKDKAGAPKDLGAYEPTITGEIKADPTLLERIENQFKESGRASLQYMKDHPNDPMINSIGTTYEAAGQLIQNVGGGAALLLDNKPLSESLVEQGKSLEEMGQSIGTGPQETANWEETTKLIEKADGLQEKLSILASRVMAGNSGLSRQAEIELRQELPALFLGGASVRGFMVASGVIDSADTAGNAALEEFDRVIKKNGSYENALEAARVAGAAAGATELAIDLTLGRVAEALTDKLGNVPAKAAARYVGEIFTEPTQEGSASAAVDIALGRNVDVNKALTQAVIGLGVSHGTATNTAGFSTTVDIAQKQENVVTNINQTVAEAAGSTDVGVLATAIDNAVNMGAEAGLDQKAVITTALGTAIVNGADINNAVDYVVNSSISRDPLSASTIASDVISAVNAVNGDVEAATSALQSSLENAGIDFSTAADIVATAKANADTTSLFPEGTIGVDQTTEGTTPVDTTATGTLTGTTAADTTAIGTVTDPTTGVTSTQSVDPNTGATSTQTVDPNSGITTNQTVDTNSGTTTTQSVDSNNNTQTTIVSDSNNNTKTTTTIDGNSNTETTTNIDGNTNINTQTVINTNTQTTTQTNNNTNITTQTTVDSNTGTTTQVTTNSNGQVTTEVTTNPDTNTETTVTTNPDTNTSTTVVVDTTTGEVVNVKTDENVEVKTVDPVVDTTTTTTTTTTPKTTLPQIPTGGSAGLMMPAVAGEISRLAPQMLRSWVTGEKMVDPLAGVKEVQREMERDAIMQNIDPRLASILRARMGDQQDTTGLGALDQFGGSQESYEDETPYYSYGSEIPIDEVLGDSFRNYAQGGYVEPLMAQGGMTLPLLAKSGGLPKMAKGREDFRDGKHVAGEGDGQSDDIPALLADGEFVFPADVVSALGNGSSKAGTDKLYEMMHEIRARARSTGSKDLPPPAFNSPLDYLKSSGKRSKK